MATAPVVHIDESGNFGENLLDPEQQVFVLAAAHLEDADANRLAGALAGVAAEAHYTGMSKGSRGQGRILDFLADPVLGPSSVRGSALHKPFMAEAKFVDFLFEPVMLGVTSDVLSAVWQTGGILSIPSQAVDDRSAWVERNVRIERRTGRASG